VAIEFVTVNDTGKLSPYLKKYYSKGKYNLMTFPVLRTKLVNKKDKNIYLGLFYGNPGSSHGLLYESEFISEEELREQIKDFADWLKAQGVI
jgi:hypothetical protein